MCTVHSRFVLVMGILTWNRTRWRGNGGGGRCRRLFGDGGNGGNAGVGTPAGNVGAGGTGGLLLGQDGMTGLT